MDLIYWIVVYNLVYSRTLTGAWIETLLICTFVLCLKSRILTGAFVDAIKIVYSSAVYKQMENEDTKMWHLGPVDLYREMINQEL